MANNERSREKRREERLAEESKAASGDRRTRLLQFAAGGVFLAIIVVVVVIIAVGGGSSSGGDASNLVEKASVEKLLGNIPQNATILGNVMSDFDFSQPPRAPVILPVQPRTDLVEPKARRG